MRSLVAGYEKLLAIPDWCFGAQRVSCCYATAADDAYSFDIAEVGLPDVGIVWEIGITPVYFSAKNNYVRLALADLLPANHDEFMRLPPFLHGLGVPGQEPRQIKLYQYAGTVVLCMRDVIQAQSHRLCIEAYAEAGSFTQVQVWAVVSSMPQEVPEWLSSGQGENLL